MLFCGWFVHGIGYMRLLTQYSYVTNGSLGPCRVNDANNVTFHPYSWNEKANVFFIDQPIGVGFSYADHGEHVVSFNSLNQ